MKTFLTLFGILFLAIAAVFGAAPETGAFPVKGDISISYRTRVDRDGVNIKPGVEDVYTLNLIVANSSSFNGTIRHRPFISNTFSRNQTQQLTFDINLNVLNPVNITQSRNVGKLSGVVPINEQNIYDYNLGSVKAVVFPMGRAQGFESRMSGLAAAKPPAQSATGQLLSKVKERINISRTSSDGKTVALALTNYDKMDFVNHVLFAGPVALYTEATVNGSLLYDYDRTAWYLNDMVVVYPTPEGVIRRDKLSGNIRWSDSTQSYDFDVRINEGVGAAVESAVFSNTATDESAFFAVDPAIPSLTGTMQYKDVKSGGVVTNSSIQVDLMSNNLTRQQVFYLTKLLLMSNIVPLNAE